MHKPQWINEEEAATLLGYKKETLRKYTKSGKLKIAYSTIAGRNYKYNKIDIDQLWTQYSTLYKK